MDHRRPIRPPHPITNGPRRALFTASSTSTSHHPPPRTTARTAAASKPAAVHIPADPSSNDPDLDLVERDVAGNYKVMAPSTAMRMGVEPPVSAEQEDKEQEDQMIALYGKSSTHWDQADEVKVVLRSSLARQVASLEADRWMFEGDGGRKT